MTSSREIRQVFRGLRIFVAMTAVSLAVAGCDELLGASASEQIETARAAFAEARYRESVVNLKSALQIDPENAEARALLGRTNLVLYRLQSAEKELLEAQKRGAAAGDFLPWLGETWIAMGKPEKVIKEIRARGIEDPAAAAAVSSVVGKARLRVAEKTFDAQHIARAEGDFLRALDLSPGYAKAHAGLAHVALYRGKLDNADAQIAAALAADPEDLDAHLLQGRIQLGRRENDDAVSTYKKAVDIHPHSPVVLSSYAHALLSAGRIDESITHIDKLLAEDPSNQSANYQRSVAALFAEDYQTALQHAETALKWSDHLPSLKVGGTAAYSLGRFELAYKYLHGYVASARDDAEARKLLAASALRLGEVRTAMDSLDDLDQVQSSNDAQLFQAVGTAAVQAGFSDQGKELLQQARGVEAQTGTQLTGLAHSLSNAGESEQSVEILERVIATNPQDAQAHWALVAAHLKSNDLAQAEAAAEAFMRALPNEPKSYVMAGFVNLGKGDAIKAREFFERALEIDPGEPDAANNLAVLALRGGDLPEATRLYESVLEHHPGHLQTLIRFGKLQIVSGELERAISLLSEALEAEPRNVEATRTLSGVYMDANDPQRALQVAEQGLATAPQDPGLLLVAGKAELAQGRASSAIRRFLLLRQQRPDLATPSMLLGQAYLADGDRDRALDAFRAATSAEPQNLEIKFQVTKLEVSSGGLEAGRRMRAELADGGLGNTYLAEIDGEIAMAENRPADAVEHFKTVLEERSTNLLTLRLAQAQNQADQKAAAHETLENWLQAHDNDNYVRNALANDYMLSGMTAKARDHLKVLVEAVPQDARVRNNLASTLLAQGAADEAIEHAQEATRLEEGNAVYLHTLGQSLLALDRAEEALPALQESVRIRPGALNPRYQLARALASTGKPQEAIDLLKDLLSREAEFENREKAADLLGQLGG